MEKGFKTCALWATFESCDGSTLIFCRFFTYNVLKYSHPKVLSIVKQKMMVHLPVHQFVRVKLSLLLQVLLFH